MALTNATLPYAATIASKGWKAAASSNRAFRRHQHSQWLVTYCGVAEAFGLKCTPWDEVLKGNQFWFPSSGKLSVERRFDPAGGAPQLAHPRAVSRIAIASSLC